MVKSKVLKWNILIFIILLIVINIISWFIMEHFDNRYLSRMAKLPAMANPNYHEIQKEWSNLKTTYQPFIGWNREPFQGKYSTIEYNNVRLTVQDNKSKNNTIRFFGGSTMWGARVEDAHTIPSWVAACTDNYSVFNHGEVGFNSRQNLAYLINLIVKRESTDMVVFYDGVNDVDHLCREMISIPGHSREIQFREKLETIYSTQSYFEGRDGIVYLAKELVSKIFFKNTVELTRRISMKFFPQLHPKAESPYTCHIDELRAQKVANHILMNWKLAKTIADKHNIEFIAILQPTIFMGNENRDYLNLDKDMGANFKMVYQLLKEQLKDYPWIYDLSETLINVNQPIFYDFCHLNEHGNKIMAEQICQILETKDEQESVEK